MQDGERVIQPEKRRRGTSLEKPLPELGAEASWRADLAMLCQFAELYQVHKPLVQEVRARHARRHQRISAIRAVEILQSLGLDACLFRGDLRDLEQMRRPVLALVEPDAFLLVLLIEHRLVMVQAGHDLHPVTLRRADFNRCWTQAWIGVSLRAGQNL
jgi:ABC-type bacteriocin/lantibiotic exporter with double-glycine peptidase domain